jgi:PAS domain S-box-containing protein
MSPTRTELSATNQASIRPNAEDIYRQIFDSAVVGLAIVELDGRVRDVNFPLCEMFGYGRDDIIGRPFPASTQHDDREDRQIQRQLLAQEINGFSLESQYVRKDGGILHALVTALLQRNAFGEPTHFLLQIVDTTALRRAQEQAARRISELERSNSDLQQFAYLASHDLQQPLRAVATYGQLLSDRYATELDGRATRWIGYITGSVDRMQGLIDDLLTLARVGTEANGFEELDTTATARRCWDSMLLANSNVQAHFDATALPVIQGDAHQIELLFQNLLGNAVKYRRRDIPLEVSVAAKCYQSPFGAIWEFGVSDNGIGFDMAYVTQIFQIFQRLHSAAEYEGTGIGLALCRRIVERHGGQIWADSVVGQGSTFTFTLCERHLG